MALPPPLYRPGIGDDPGRRVDLGPHAYIEYRLAPGGTCEIVNIEVESSHRRMGYGRRLLECLFQELRDTGRAKRVYAITRSTNEVAIQFYERTLFEVVGVLRRFYGEMLVDAIMFGRSVEGPV